MREIDGSAITALIEQHIAYIARHAEESCAARLKELCDSESDPTAAFALKVMCDNIDIAAERGYPVCQDTGMAVVFADIGRDVRINGDIYDAINEGVRRAYVPLRKSVLDPVSRINTRDNTPAVIHLSMSEGSNVKLEIMLKGFGSENMSKVYMLNPAQGLEEAKRLIVGTVADAGSNPCPPVIVGVGLGGTLEKACLMSKHALFRKIGSRNEDSELDAIEQELLDKINSLGIGAQGFGGKATALGVFIEKFPTHISSLPVAVNILCHCSRCAVINI